MPPRITTLIDKLDGSEIVRDQLAAIIKMESEAQEALAIAASRDPRLWRLHVFVERADAWSEFQECPEQIDAQPIVNVSFESASFDEGSSNHHERQKAVGTFHVDCYGYGVSQETVEGHMPADEAAGREALRGLKLVRNILMSAHYVYLGMPRGTNQIVWRRWPQSTTLFQPTIDGAAIQRVVGARLTMQVEYTETAPQVATEELGFIFATVNRAENGEIYFTAQYGESE